MTPLIPKTREINICQRKTPGRILRARKHVMIKNLRTGNKDTMESLHTSQVREGKKIKLDLIHG